MRELGVAKLGDRYVLPEAGAPVKNDFSTLKQFVSAMQTAGTNLTVLRTTVGSAQSVAVAIDTCPLARGDRHHFRATTRYSSRLPGAREQRKLGERLHAIFGL